MHRMPELIKNWISLVQATIPFLFWGPKCRAPQIGFSLPLPNSFPSLV